MRHSDINLTRKHYTHILLDDKRVAVSSLPKINIQEEVAEATGTKDAANLGRIQTPALCPNSDTIIKIRWSALHDTQKNLEQVHGYTQSNSAYFLPDCAN